jgi:DNA-binding transcriptional ArsR family regulator
MMVSALDFRFYLTILLNMDALSQTFSALADPTRRAILARLADGDATVGELAEPFEMSLPAVSRHLKVLTQAGLIERSTEAQWRRCALRGEGLRAAADWIEFYRHFWEESFNRLDAFLSRTAPQPEASAPEAAPDAPKPDAPKPASSKPAREKRRVRRS